MKLICHLVLLFCGPLFGAMPVPNKPVLRQPEIKPYAVPSLKLLSFDSGIKKFGRDFIEEFEKNSTMGFKAYEDLKSDSREYYKLCCHEIDQMLEQRYPDSLPKSPPAQPLHKLINEIFKKRRFELLAIVNQRYYAQLKWPAITLLASAGYTIALKVLLDEGADINARDLLKYTAAGRAAKNGKLETVKLLIQRGADLTCIDVCQKTAAQHAADGIKNAKSIGNEKNAQIFEEILQLINAKLEKNKNPPLRDSQPLKPPKDKS